MACYPFNALIQFFPSFFKILSSANKLKQSSSTIKIALFFLILFKVTFFYVFRNIVLFD